MYLICLIAAYMIMIQQSYSAEIRECDLAIEFDKIESNATL